MRSTLSAVICIILSACSDKPEVKACEKFIKSDLAAPTTYKRQSVRVVDVGPMNAKRFWADSGFPDPINDTDKTIRRIAESRRGELVKRREVYISYDSDNASDVPIRGIEQCSFLIEGDDITPDVVISAGESMAETIRSGRQLVHSGLLPEDGKFAAKPGYECCIVH